ncbi:hypothetical protein PVA48_04190 [Akkermansia sp. JRP_AM1]|uniref:hypothetical protein n=1 Tax=Akkermansia sp. JRP_AM1 TaxID=3414159 RepID=UPI003A759370
MVRALRNGIMLLTLLLVIVGGTGMVSVCPCHQEVFLFSCSCHHDAAPCGCRGDHGPGSSTSSPLAGHLCEHQRLEIDDLTLPVLHAPLPQPCIIWQTFPDFHHLAQSLLLTSQTSDSAIPAPLTPSGTTARYMKAFNFPC